MKKVLFFSMMALMVFGFLSCTPEEGPRGKTGPAGKDGVDGNANVTTYLFTDSAKIAWNYYSEISFIYDSLFSIPGEILTSGLILVYTQVKTNSMWYAAPGLGYAATYQTRLWISDNFLVISAANPDGSIYTGTSLPALKAVKIVLVPSTTLIQIRKSGHHGDFRDHDETMEILRNLPEII